MAEYIEREALLKAAEKDKAIGLCEADIADVRHLINGQHAADVAPVVHSWWESYETSAYGGYKDGEVRWLARKFYRCERCRNGSAIRSHYCPNCGAKMDGGNNADNHD